MLMSAEWIRDLRTHVPTRAIGIMYRPDGEVDSALFICDEPR